MQSRRSPPLQQFPIKGFGGLDTMSPEEAVAPNRFTQLVDFRTDQNGVLMFRERVTWFGIAVSGGGADNDPVSFMEVVENSQCTYGKSALVFAAGRPNSTVDNCRLYALALDEIDVAAAVRLGDVSAMCKLNSNFPVSGAKFDDYYAAANEFTPLDPIKGTTVNPQRYEGIIGRYVFVWRQRFCVLNTTRYGCELIISSILRGDRYTGAGATEWTPFAGDFYVPLGAKRILVSKDADEEATGVVLWNEVPIIGTNKGLYRVDPNSFGVFPITKSTGVRERTMCVYRGNVFFLGDDDVYMMDSWNSVKPVTRTTIQNDIFSGDNITMDTWETKELVIDTSEEWTNQTQIPVGNGAGAYKGGFTWSVGLNPIQNSNVQQGGFIWVAAAPPAPGAANHGDRELTDAVKLTSLFPDYGGGAGVKEHMSNFVRLDFIMTNTWDEWSFNNSGGTDDSQYPRSAATIQFYLAYRQGTSDANCKAQTYVELMPNSSGYNRDNRVLSFVVKIDHRGDSNVFDRWFQFALRMAQWQDAGPLHTSNPQVHRVRISWLSPVKKGSNYLDYRQQPYMCVAKDKLWLHLSGQTESDDTYAFVMDHRGEWTKYRNLDAFSMAEVDATHGLNNTLHRRFMIGKRWQRYSGSYEHPFYIETEEWDDFLTDPNQDFTGDDYNGAKARTGKLSFNDITKEKRLRFMQLMYAGSFDDAVTMICQGSEMGLIPASLVQISLPYHSAVDSELISLARYDGNFGTWFRFLFELEGPVAITQDFRLSYLIPAIQTLTRRPTLGQAYPSP